MKRFFSMPNVLCISLQDCFLTKGDIVGIIVIDVKGLMLSLMSYYIFTNIRKISKIDLYIEL